MKEKKRKERRNVAVNLVFEPASSFAVPLPPPLAKQCAFFSTSPISSSCCCNINPSSVKVPLGVIMMIF